MCCAGAAAAFWQSMWTALHWAVTNEHTACAKSLIKAGADTSLRDKVRPLWCSAEGRWWGYGGAQRRARAWGEVRVARRATAVQVSLCSPCAASHRPHPPPSRLSTQRGETALDFAKYNSNKGESIPLLDKVGRAAQPPNLALALSHSLGPNPSPSSIPSPCPCPSSPWPQPSPSPWCPRPRARAMH